MTLDLAY